MPQEQKEQKSEKEKARSKIPRREGPSCWWRRRAAAAAAEDEVGVDRKAEEEKKRDRERERERERKRESGTVTVTMPGRHDGGWYGSSRQPESRLAEADCLSIAPPLSSSSLSLSLLCVYLSLSLSCFFRLFQRLLPSAVNRYAAISASCSSTRTRALRCISSSVLSFSPDFSHPSLPIPFCNRSTLSLPLALATLIIACLAHHYLPLLSCDTAHFIDSEMTRIVFYCKFILPVSLVSELSRFAFFPT